MYGDDTAPVVLTTPQASPESSRIACPQSAAEPPQRCDTEPGLTIFSLLKDGPSFSRDTCGGLPPMPSSSSANRFLETTFLYTQPRYSIVDWIQVRKWYSLLYALLSAYMID